MDKENRDSVESLVYECIATHNEMLLVQLIESLENDYTDLASLATFGEYERDWTHEDVLNYVTYHT